MSETASPLLTTAEVAKRFKVSPSTVARWARDGIIPCLRTPGGHPRFRQVDVEKALTVTGEAVA